MSVRRLAATSAAAVLIAAAGASAMAQETAPTDIVRADASTAPAPRGEVNRAVVWVDAADPAKTRIVASGGLDGLLLFDPAGRRLGAVEAGEVGSTDLRQGVDLGFGPIDLVAATDTTTNSLRFFRLNGDVLSEIGGRAIPLGFAAEGVCLLRNAKDGLLYAVVVGDGGEVDQNLVYGAADGRVDARPVRRLGLSSPAEHCVADDRTGDLYVSQQSVGIWRFRADPEADATPVLIDAPRLGRITEEVGGLALYDGGDGARYLIAADASGGRLYVYDRGNEDRWLGAVAAASADGATVEEPGGLGAGGGLLAVADEGAEGGADYKLLSIAAAVEAAGGSAGEAQPVVTPVRPPFPTVVATVETPPVASFGDAADDPAIWANPADPAASLVVATDKKSGLYLYDMQGRELQHLADGKMNNVDLRAGFRLGGEEIVLVAASDRTTKAIALYRLDTEARRLVGIADGVQPTEQGDPYGLCLYQDPADGRVWVFINDSNGEKRQWEILDAGNGRVGTRRVRDVAFSSQVEGCVADDETGVLYVAEEDVGFWRLSARPDGGTEMAPVQRIEDNPALAADLEGVGLYDLGGGRGYLVVSSQGNDSYAVYRREGDQAYLGSFAVVADPAAGVDGIAETDGLEVTSRNLGPGFEHGALIAQDGRNMLPGERQNYKYVPWSAIAEALDLESR